MCRPCLVSSLITIPTGGTVEYIPRVTKVTKSIQVSMHCLYACDYDRKHDIKRHIEEAMHGAISLPVRHYLPPMKVYTLASAVNPTCRYV